VADAWARLRGQLEAGAAGMLAAQAAAAPGAGKSSAAARRRVGMRMYAAAKGGRTTGGFGSSGNSSADAELSSSLTQLRARSRQMVRDSAYARRAKALVVNNVVGAGIGLQAQVPNTRGGLRGDINTAIEEAFRTWSEAGNCHTGGALHFGDLERAAMGQVFEAGDPLVRMHFQRFGASQVPLALELVEPERLLDTGSPGVDDSRAEIRQGVEVDRFGRALAYWIRPRHQTDVRLRGYEVEKYERVPADQVFHLRIVDRWPQTRGEPWMATVLRKMDELNEYTGSEVSAARASSMYFGTIETPDQAPLVNAEEGEDEQGLMDIEPLTIQELKPGEKFNFHQPTRPNAALDPFMRHMLREMAAGCGVSYESLSRDYSQSNYSSSRLALLDDRDLWRVLQQWWIRSFRIPLHRVWMRQAVLAGAIPGITVEQYALDARRFEAVQWKPRGWSWVDPTREVNAYKEAIKANLTTATDVIAATADGRDIEDVIATRKRELEMLREAGILVDTTVAPEPKPAPAAPPAPAAGDDEDDDTAAKPRARVMAFTRDHE
jgi:lambda family phage portal protein